MEAYLRPITNKKRKTSQIWWDQEQTGRSSTSGEVPGHSAPKLKQYLLFLKLFSWLIESFLYNSFLFHLSTQITKSYTAIYAHIYTSTFSPCPSGLTHSHNNGFTERNLGFGILLNDTAAYRLEQPGMTPPTFQLVPLTSSRKWNIISRCELAS